MAKVSIIGSGNVGANTAFFIAETGVEDVLLYDVKEGMAAGKALDIMEAAPIRKYRNRITGTDRLDDIRGSEIVLICAGTVRRPGMKREDLFAENRAIIEELAPNLARLVPDSVVINVTEPIDIMTTLLQRLSGFPRERVIGLGTCIDSVRLRAFISRDTGISMENISALVIGRHSDAMIGLPRYCSVSGVPLPEIMNGERIAELLEETRRSGDLIVDLAQRSSAFYGPSAVASELADSIHMDLGRVFSVSVVTDGEYGLSGVAIGLPVILGTGGVKRVLTPELSADELERLTSTSRELLAVAEGIL